MVASRKTSSGLSLIPEERSRTMPSSSKSTESLYSNTSSSRGSASILYRRNTAATNGRFGGFIPASTEVRQRVLSARRLRMKTFQNQLADAQQHISELAHENRILRTLHKRQDLALSKYESTNAELPKLLHSHAEEIRVWQMKYRNTQAQNKELLYKLKQKESLVLSLSDQNKHLAQLNKDKNLEERQRLSEKVQQLEIRLQEKETDMKLLARRLQLETKSCKKELQMEQKKRKDTVVQLEKLKLELSTYEKIEELNMNEKLSKLSIGSMSNLANGIPENDERNSVLQTILTPLTTKKPIEIIGDHSNRSIGTDKSDFGTSRTARKFSANKLVGNTSTHRGNGDGPLEEREVVNTTESQIDIETLESKSDDNNSYDDEFEEIGEDKEESNGSPSTDADADADANDIENLLEVTAKEIAPPKPTKLEDMGFIRKEITEEFKQRETFLNTFCRQATNDSSKMNANRKSKLLAALKNIEGSTSLD